MADKNILLKIDNVSKHFRVSGGILKAVNGVSLEIKKGETLGLVGESGCGKSTLGRVVMGIYEPTKGKIVYNGKEVHINNAKNRLAYAKHAQMIFQDPYASLNPRMTVESIIAEGMEIHGMYTPEKRKQRVHELLELVGLNKEHANRFPHEFSGGQRQRIGIARAMIMEPELVVADEPISALDVSIRAQVLNLLKEAQRERGVTYLFIAHDLSVVRFISDRIAVIYRGEIVELAEAEELFNHPIHPYTRALLSAVPIPDPILAKKKKLHVYDPSVHDYSVDKPTFEEVVPGHFVYGNKAEIEKYRAEYND